MGFFNFLFGTGEHRNVPLSDKPYTISKEDIKKVVSRIKIKTLSQHEETLVEDIIIMGRYDNHISLKGIDMLMGQLEHEHKISKNDRKGVVAAFKDYFITRNF